jgi:hypothetical protein
MGQMGSTTTVRARQMREVLAQWQGSGLTLRGFGQQHGIAVSTLRWWRRVFRAADAAPLSGVAEPAVRFTEVPPPVNVFGTAGVVEVVLPSGHLVRVPAGVDSGTLQRVLQALQSIC